MTTVNYQNPGTTDLILDSVTSDDTTTPSTKREIVIIGSPTKYSNEDVIASLRFEIREMNANLLRIIQALNSICVALNAMPIDSPRLG